MNELQLLTCSSIDLKWFQENSEKLRANYESQFVAIKNCSVIDADKNASILIGKLEKKGEDSNLVLIKFVTPKGEIVIL
ncbi:MAG: DUF5678 domain-containing protein [Candidatus Pacearchaeota archaeon]|nr:DUF5678 domain-containing protein [Candidatus Pacearchaeota archaeon]